MCVARKEGSSVVSGLYTKFSLNNEVIQLVSRHIYCYQAIYPHRWGVREFEQQPSWRKATWSLFSDWYILWRCCALQQTIQRVFHDSMRDPHEPFASKCRLLWTEMLLQEGDHQHWRPELVQSQSLFAHIRSNQYHLYLYPRGLDAECQGVPCRAVYDNG